jgi:hypothetical protein
MNAGAHGLVWRIFLTILGLGAILFWAYLGIGVLVAMFGQPLAGQETVILAARIALVVGWVASLVWLLLELVRGRLRFLLAPIAALLWILALVSLIQGGTTSPFGY